MTLYRHMLLRLLPVLALLVLAQIALGFVLVLWPVLDDSAARHALSLDAAARGTQVDGIRRVAPTPAVAGASWLPYHHALRTNLVGLGHTDARVLRLRDQPNDYVVQFAGASYVFDHARLVGTRPREALAIWIASVVLAALLGAAWLAAGLSRPIRQLAAELPGLASGQGDAPGLAPPAVAEIGTLRNAFVTLLVRLREAVEQRTTLLLGLAHDLRGPLARLRVQIELLCRRDTDDPRIARLRSEVVGLSAIIDGFVDAAQGMAHERRNEVLREDFSAWLADSYAHVQRVAVTGTGDAIFHGNAAALQRIVANLVDNALAHAAPAPVRVTLQAGGSGWLVEVTDEGPGIAPTALPELFRPLRSTREGHSGLGLSIAKLLADQNGWTLSLDSNLPRGLVARLDCGRHC